MKNHYRICGNLVVIKLKYKNRNYYTFIDKSDLPIAQSLIGTWKVYIGRGKIYAGMNKQIDGKWKTFKLHRMIVDAPDGTVVDHANSLSLDNRRNNLIITTHHGNMKNKQMYQNNKSGVKNVHWHKATQKWAVTCKTNGKVKYYGVYKNFEEAVNVAESLSIT